MSLLLSQLAVSKPFAFQGWQWHYDNAAVWQGAPSESALLHPLLTVGGKPPQKVWHYNWDDAAFWLGAPRGSALLARLLTGYAPSRQWHWDFDANEALWLARPAASLYVQAPASGTPVARAPFYFPRPDVSATYIWEIERNLNLATPVALPFVPYVWRFGIDDQSIWQRYGTASAQLGQLLATKPLIPPQWGLGNQDDASTWPSAWTQRNLNTDLVHSPLIPFFWKFGQDDASSWQGKPVPSAVLSQLLTAGGQPPEHLASFAHDSGASVWQPTVYLNFALTNTPVQVAPPTPAWAAQIVSIADEPIWNAHPIQYSQPTPPPPVGQQDLHNLPFFATPGQLRTW